MNTMLTQAKTTIKNVFVRAMVCLEDVEAEMAARAGRPPRPLNEVPFEVQFAVYRDYDCGTRDIFAASGWETNPTRLFSFLDRQAPKGGGGDGGEAVEVGLEFAVKEAMSEKGLTQVILIADDVAKTPAMITASRARIGSKKWTEAGFAPDVSYISEMEKLRSLPPEKQVLVHTLRLSDNEDLVENFTDIHSRNAQPLEAKNLYLDLSDEEFFMSFITVEIIRRAVSTGEQGDLAIASYNRRYRTAHL